MRKGNDCKEMWGNCGEVKPSWVSIVCNCKHLSKLTEFNLEKGILLCVNLALIIHKA
jgi:hypothetical protein